MKFRTRILILILAVMLVWISYCLGIYTAFEIGEKRKAEIAYSDAKIVSLSAKEINAQDYDKALNRLNELIEFRIFYIETTWQDLESVNATTFILRPNLVFKDFTLTSYEFLPSTKELNQLKLGLKSDTNTKNNEGEFNP